MDATIIVASVIGVVVLLIIAGEIRKKIKGKPSCTCGGNCGACGICPSRSEEK